MSDLQRITRLPNGFRIVTEHMPALQSASVGIWIDAGSRHEDKAQNGIAHFLEHMAFKGTHTRSALDIAESIEDVGGYINAYTSREMTAYYARILGEHVPLAVDVISDIVLNSTFDPNELEVERGVILQEIGQSNDTPDDIIFDWLQEQAFPDQPLGRAILGPSERVQNFNRQDLIDFVQSHYCPSRMVLAAAGNIDHDQIVAQATAIFAGLDKKASRVRKTANYRGGYQANAKDLEQAHFALAFETVPYKSSQIYTAQIASAVLGGGMSSRLFQEVREKRGLCYSIYASLGGFSDTGMMTIYAGTSAEDLGQLASVTLDELTRATQDITSAEINRARAQMKSGLLMGLESSSARCDRLARMMTIWDRVPAFSEVIDKIEAVQDADVMAFVDSMIRSKEPSLVMYGPMDTAPSFEQVQKKLAA